MTGMARRKRQPKTAESSAAAEGPASSDGGVAVITNGKKVGAPAWRDFVIALLLLLALSATAFIWFDEKPSQRLGLTLTGIVWAVALVGLLGRFQARRTVRDLKTILAHDQIVHARLEPEITEAQSGVPMKHVSAWLVTLVGIGASAMLWYHDVIGQTVGQRQATLIVGVTVSLMIAFSVGANAINRLKTRRLTRDFRAALNSERLALGTLGALDVMISSCLPTGERTRFNDCFLKFVGRTAAQMKGHGWLDVVHPDNRQAVLDLVTKPQVNGRSRRHDICVKHRDGDYVWLRETLAPRFDAKGEVIEFIGTAFNVTQHLENEAALEKHATALKADFDKTSAELSELRAELSKVKTSRNYFEKNLVESREEVKNLQEALSKAEAGLEKVESEASAKIGAMAADAQERLASAEGAAGGRVAKLEEALKLARQESQHTVAENKKLTEAFAKLQDEIGQVRQQDAGLRDQIARHMKENREVKGEATEAQKSQAQYRAEHERLAKRCKELEAQLAAKDKALSVSQAQAQKSGAAAAAEIERRMNEVSAEALATQLRKQLAGMQRMTGEMLKMALDGPVKDAAYNTAATVRTMSDLVNQALSGATPSPTLRSANATSFDIRRTAQGVCDLLAAEAQAKGAELAVEVAPNVPDLVHGDDLSVRAAMMSLTSAALQLVHDGKLTIRLSEDVNTPAHSTIRCELKHPSARVKTDALEAALAIKSTDKSMPDPIKQPMAHQAAKAWRTIRALEGTHGSVIPDEGGFAVWFTFMMGRPAAASGAMRRGPLAMADAAAAHMNCASEGQTTSDSGGAHIMPRMPQELLNCNLGEVAELGADSIRVFCAKSPRKKDVTISFDDVDSEMKLRAQVSWSKKSGRKYDVGLKFVDISPAEQKQVLRIAMQHRKVKTILDTV